MKPFLTIVLPVYNGAKFLSETIDSLTQQHDPPFSYEIIAVDDGSTDNSIETLKKLKQKVVALKIISLPKNQGVATARNTGILAATGEWLSFIDQDDCWNKNKLNLQFNYLQSHPGLDFVLAKQQMYLLDNYSRPDWVKSSWLLQPQAGYLLGCLLIKTEKFKQIGLLNPELVTGIDDVDWFIQAKKKAAQYHMLNQVLLHRKIHDNNASQYTKNSNQELLKILRQKIATSHKKRHKDD